MSIYPIAPPVAETAYKALGLSTWCGCEVCLAGGSCIQEPFATNVEELIERLPWENIAAALAVLGLKAVPQVEEFQELEEARCPAATTGHQRLHGVARDTPVFDPLCTVTHGAAIGNMSELLFQHDEDNTR